MLSVFIKDRFILENVAIAQEIISEINFNKEQDILLKLDFEKTHDKVKWNLLLDVLRARVFLINEFGLS